RAFVYARQLSVPLLEPHADTDIFLSRDYHGGYGWLFPKRGVANVGIGVTPEARSRLKRLLDALHGGLIASGRARTRVLGRTGGLIPVGGPLCPHAARRGQLLLLAGDAAGLTNPVTGAGIHAAVLSGRLAGSAAAGYLGGAAQAGAEYGEELHDVL